MMNSKSKASQDAELLKDFVEAIERRAKELVDGETKGFTLGYLSSFVEQNMTPKMRKAIKNRMARLPAKTKKVKKVKRVTFVGIPETDEDDSEESATPPSQHPERRRVRLVVVVSDAGVGSVLRFADAPNDVVTDAGAARGSLADAVTNMWFDCPVNVAQSSTDSALRE